MKSLVTRLIATLLVLAALYLVTINVALNLPATRAWLSGLQPETFAVNWTRAWSPYPLRVHLDGFGADGQSAAEQWQVDARRAAVSVSLLPLLKGEVRVHDLDLVDIDLRLRPLAAPGEGHGPATEYFPVIRNRDPDATVAPAPDEESGMLVLEIDDVHVRGDHSFWVSHLRGSVPGEVRGSLRMDTGAGRLSLAGGALDLALLSLKVGPAEPVARVASISGRVDIPPFSLAETRGLEFMRVPELDAQVDLPVQGLDFLAWILEDAAPLGLSGQGRLRGRLVLSRGEVLRGTDLVVEAHALSMHLGAYAFHGDGAVELLVDPDDEAQADLIVRFDRVRAELDADDDTYDAAPAVLFTGRGLVARLHAAETDPTTTSTAVETRDLADEVDLRFTLDIPVMQVDDLAVYDRLFPDDWDLTLLGGSGTVGGHFELTADALSMDLDLASDDAELRLGDYHAAADLLLEVRAAAASGDSGDTTAALDMAGTLLRLDDARLAVAADDDTRAPVWSAALRVDAADLAVPLTPEQAADGAIAGVARTLSDQGLGALLASADGAVSAVLTVSRLDWIARLLGRPLGLGLGGSGELDAAIVLDDGFPAPGSALRIPRETLEVALLDHRIDGAGAVSLVLEAGADGPRARLAVALDDARVRRRDEDEPSIGQVRMAVELLVADPFAAAAAEIAATAALKLTIKSARVHDLSTYNAYLPPGGPLSVLGGEGSLTADLSVAADSADGQVLLTADDVRLAVGDQRLSGNLRLDVLIRDGSGEQMRFDITGSSLAIEGLRVAGADATTSDRDWHARLQFEDTEVVWQKPMKLDMTSGITIQDTRPFVALFDNLRDHPDWIDEMLTLEDLAGHIVLTVDGDEAVLKDAMVTAPELGVRAKGRSGPVGQEGMLLLRWHNLTTALELDGDRRHIRVGNARARFDDYAPERASLSALGSADKDPEPAPAEVPAPERSPAAARTAPAAPPPPASPFEDHSL